MYTETVTILGTSIEGGNVVVAGQPHAIPPSGATATPDQPNAFVTIMQAGNNRRVISVPAADVAKYVPGAKLILTLDFAPAS